MSPLSTQTAAVLYGPSDIRIEERASFKPPRGHAQVRILATGLCGSDLHYYIDARNGDFALRSPLVLGHEAAGIVVAVGPNAIAPNGKPLRIGQRVAIEAGIPCSKALNTTSTTTTTTTGETKSKTCVYCASGRYNLCKDLRFASSAKTFPHLDGTLQEKMIHPASLLFPLPDSVSPELGALSEPLSVVLHASRRAGLLQHPLSPASLHFASLSQSTSSPSSPSPSSSNANPFASPSSPSSPTTNAFPHPSYLSHHLSSPHSAQSVLVLGAGTIGLMTCALAQAWGARKVVAVDINAKRLEFARRNGFADEVYCLPHPSNNQPQPATCCGSSPSTKSTSTSTTQSTTTKETKDTKDTQPQKEKDAKESINATLERAKERATAALAAFKEPEGFDIVYECTGAEPCIQMAIHTAITGGKVMLIGMGTRHTSLPLSAAALREVDVLGSFRYAGTYEEGLGLLGVFAAYNQSTQSNSTSTTSTTSQNTSTTTATSTSMTSTGSEEQETIEETPSSPSSECTTRKSPTGIRTSLPDLTSLITHRFALGETQRAFEVMRRGVDEEGGMVMKVVVS